MPHTHIQSEPAAGEAQQHAAERGTLEAEAAPGSGRQCSSQHSAAVPRKAKHQCSRAVGGTRGVFDYVFKKFIPNDVFIYVLCRYAFGDIVGKCAKAPD